MNAVRRMRIPPPSTGRTEHDADEANKIREPNNRLISLLARWLIGSLVHEEISLDHYIFSGMGETLEFFSHLFFLLIE
jgi:hypothetical protein